MVGFSKYWLLALTAVALAIPATAAAQAKHATPKAELKRRANKTHIRSGRASMREECGQNISA